MAISCSADSVSPDMDSSVEKVKVPGHFFAYKPDQLKPSSSPGNYRFFFPSYGLLLGAWREILRIDTIQGCAGKIKAALSL